LVQANATLEKLHDPDPRVKAAARRLLIAVSPAALDKNTRKTLEATLVESLKTDSADVMLGLIAVGIGSLAADLTDEDQKSVSNLLAALRAAISKTEDFGALPELTRAYTMIASKLKVGSGIIMTEEASELRSEMGITKDSVRLPSLGRSYAAIVRRDSKGDLTDIETLGILRRAIEMTDNHFELEELEQSYFAVANTLKEGNPRAVDEMTKLREAIVQTDDVEQRTIFMTAYMLVLRKVKKGDAHAAGELVALRVKTENSDMFVMGRVGASDKLGDLALAYAKVAEKLEDGDPRIAEEVATLRNAISNSMEASRRAALAQAYAAIAGRLNGGQSNEEVLAALRQTITNAGDPAELSTLALAYGSVVMCSPKFGKQSGKVGSLLYQPIHLANL
jgi:hypothetical protein